MHIVVRLKDEPGSLGKVLALLGSHVDLVGSASYSLGDGTAILSGFAKALSAGESASYIERLLLKSGFVSECQVKEDVDGVLVDSFHLGIEAGTGQAYVLIPASGLSHMFEQLVKTFGSGGETILFNQGMSLGKENVRSFERVTGTKLNLDKLIELTPLFSALGWGVGTPTRSGGPELVTIEFADCFECATGGSSRRECAFVRGYLEGSASAATGKELRCEELNCRLKGAKVCEFVLFTRT